jgi:hypothetical protein
MRLPAGTCRALPAITSLFLVAIWCAPSAGQPRGGALSFASGTNDFVRVPIHPSLGSETFTLEMWVKRAEPLLDQHCVFFRSAAGVGKSNGLVLTYGYDGRDAWTVFVAGKPITGRKPQQPGRWAHLAVTYDKSRVRLYHDGVLEVDKALAERLDWNGDLYLGVELDDHDSALDEKQAHCGLIDDVRLWSVARTRDEIAASRDGDLPASSESLVLFLAFDEVGGLLAHDGSGLGNHGLLGIPHGRKSQEAKMSPRRVWVGSERNSMGVTMTGPLPAPAPPYDPWGQPCDPRWTPRPALPGADAPPACNGGCPVHSPARRVQ